MEWEPNPSYIIDTVIATVIALTILSVGGFGLKRVIEKVGGKNGEHRWTFYLSHAVPLIGAVLPPVLLFLSLPDTDARLILYDMMRMFCLIVMLLHGANAVLEVAKLYGAIETQRTRKQSFYRLIVGMFFIATLFGLSQHYQRQHDRLLEAASVSAPDAP